MDAIYLDLSRENGRYLVTPSEMDYLPEQLPGYIEEHGLEGCMAWLSKYCDDVLVGCVMHNSIVNHRGSEEMALWATEKLNWNSARNSPESVKETINKALKSFAHEGETVIVRIGDGIFDETPGEFVYNY